LLLIASLAFCTSLATSPSWRLRCATWPAASPTRFNASSGLICGRLIFGAFRLGAFSFGLGSRSRTPRFLFRLFSASPPARPSSAAPPATAGPFAFPAIVARADPFLSPPDDRRLADEPLELDARDVLLLELPLFAFVERLPLFAFVERLPLFAFVERLLFDFLRLEAFVEREPLVFEPLVFVCAIASLLTRLVGPGCPGTS
jgi:hypothetical protein